jgi:Fur family ferric uptake transcriptional regulator
VIAGSRDHLTPGEIYQDVNKLYPTIGLVTVYRTLDMLAGLGLICEVHAAGSCRSYLLRRPSEHHHHLICSACGAVVDFTGCDLSELEQRLSRETGFEIEGHLLELFGRCQDCGKVALV